MAEVSGLESGTQVRVGEFDERDRLYPPHPDPKDRYFRPTELHLAEIFAEEIEPPPEVPFEQYKARAEPTWNQRGLECTGFSLAAIADYHLRKHIDDETWEAMSPEERAAQAVSRRMVYEMAQEFDGRGYESGSTLRGALRGWKMLGIASNSAWPYAPGDEYGDQHGRLTLARVIDAAARPSGPYWSIKPTDVRHMKDALARGFPLYACAKLHEGWYRLYLPNSGGVIRRGPDDKYMKVAHAFVIVGYDGDGFWIHNSFGERWADDGYALLPYDEWDEYGEEVWVVTPPPPPERVAAASPGPPAPADPDATHADMWRHLVAVGDDGRLLGGGLYGQDVGAVKTNVWLFEEQTEGWANRRLAVVADSGYWAIDATVDQLRAVRDRFMEQEIYPLFVVWETPWYVELLEWLLAEHGLRDAIQSDGEAQEAARAKIVAAASLAPRVWREVERRAHAACDEPATRDGKPVQGRLGQPGAARILAAALEYKRGQHPLDIHLIGHGAGDLFLAELAALLPGRITSCNLLAPTTTMRRFTETYRPMLDDGRLQHLNVHVLDEHDEAGERFGPLPGSLLQLVADVLAVQGVKLRDAIARRERPDGSIEYVWQIDPVPVLGMARFLARDPEIQRLRGLGKVDVRTATGATHVGLLTDPAVLDATIADIRAQPSLAATYPVKKKEPPAQSAPPPPPPPPAPAPPPPRPPVRRDPLDPLGGSTRRDPLSGR